jgi:hypothetical protein
MKAPTLKLSANVIPLCIALVLGGILGVVPAFASQVGLHVVPSPFINNSSLNAAGAIASNDIWAVGEISNGSSSTQTLAEHFNGTDWSVVATPNLNATLNGVAGAATGDVWAVGNQSAGNSFNTLIEHWNGTNWSVVSSPKVPSGSGFTGITAPATNNVWAAGFLAGPSGSSTALVEHWDGNSWNLVSSPSFTSVTGLTGVSSDSSADVWAVGGLAGGGTTSVHWNGQTWTQIQTARIRFGGVSAVAALSATNVWAVGTGPGTPTGGFSAHPTALVEHWDGSAWSVAPSPNPNPQGNNSLVAIVAVNSSDVWAVGLQLKGPFTEHCGGSQWTVVATPSGAASLIGMTALGSGTVVVVGHGTNNSGIVLTN